MRKILILFMLSLMVALSKAQPLLTHPISTQAEIGHAPCRDTLKIFSFVRGYDIGIILPSWPTIVGENYVAELEGTVISDPKDGSNGPHVSGEELPFYHYSHDVNINVQPDETPDHRYTNLTPYLVYDGENGIKDTVLRKYMHVEWESGLAMSNYINPLRKLNNEGKSGGFFSAGHERGDVIWNWPSIGDWVHVEGTYVWDRGHPPAYAEIHPARLIATKRNLPTKIWFDDSTSKFATRIDVFASGDGGALRNNRSDVKPFIRRVKMGSKDYDFVVKTNLPKPSAMAHLKYRIGKNNADNFSAAEKIEVNDSGSIHIVIPWRSEYASDLDIYARSIYLYWDEGNGTAETYPIDEIKVNLSKLYFKKLSESDGEAEVRLFVNVGSDWIFLNDFYGKKGRVLSRGMGKTFKKDWTLNNEFTLYLPHDKNFRVYMAGWEVDGIDDLMGDLLNPYSDCDRKTKFNFKKKLFDIKHMLLAGCMDDEYGEISRLHNSKGLSDTNFFTWSPKDGINDDPCPFSKYPLKDRYFLSYTINKIK